MTAAPLKPKDIVVALTVLERSVEDWTYDDLGDLLQMSTSQVYYALERLDWARLYDGQHRLVRFEELIEFLSHGVRYAFATRPGEMTRGIPTAMSSSAGRELLASSGEEPGWVWPTPEGNSRGQRVDPLYDELPAILSKSELPRLRDRLALIDIIRIGSARERDIAAEELSNRLSP